VSDDEGNTENTIFKKLKIIPAVRNVKKKLKHYKIIQ